MEIWLFGNPDIEEDSLPLRLRPSLMKQFPEHTFLVQDPNEEWVLPDILVMIDTVEGLRHARSFDSLDEFSSTPHVTMHDFDVGMKLQWLQKLKKLPPYTLIGVPKNGDLNEASHEVAAILRRI